jgi:hypothetical protein
MLKKLFQAIAITSVLYLVMGMSQAKSAESLSASSLRQLLAESSRVLSHPL